jgi:hypothetical protein
MTDNAQNTIRMYRDENGRGVTEINGRINSRGNHSDESMRRNADFLVRSFHGNAVVVDELTEPLDMVGIDSEADGHRHVRRSSRAQRGRPKRVDNRNREERRTSGFPSNG